MDRPGGPLDCLTCGACVQECPVGVEHIDMIVDMRRNLTMERAEIPETGMNALMSMEQRGHPWRGTTYTRTDWAEGLDVPTLAQHPTAEVLFWVGCTAALEKRSQSVARSMASVLKRAGVDFAILGDEEGCTGDPARRMGNEYLYQIMAQQNIETFTRYDVKKIVTICPHCFNTIKNEYPHLGGDYQVLHYSEFVAELIADEVLKPLVTIDTIADLPRLLLPRTSQRRVRRSPRDRRGDPRPPVARDGEVPRQGLLLRRRRRSHVDGGKPRPTHQPYPHRPVPRNGRRHRGRLLPLLPPNVRRKHPVQRVRPNRHTSQRSPRAPRREPGLVPFPVTPLHSLPRPAAVAFDLDGTLIDTESILIEAQRRTLKAFGIHDLPPEHPRTFGMGMEPGVTRLRRVLRSGLRAGAGGLSSTVGSPLRDRTHARCPVRANC